MSDQTLTPADWTLIVNAVVAAVTGSGVPAVLDATVNLDAAEVAIAMRIMGNGWADSLRALGATDDDVARSIENVLERTVAAEVERGLAGLSDG